ncbi:MAG: flagellar basal-body MS-ring/collar protein FliF [bacterium]
MPDFIEQMLNRFGSFWGNLSRRQQSVFFVITVVTLTVVIGLFYWSTRPQYVTLYNREMDADEAAKIADVLDDKNVEYELDGNVIKVPFTRVDHLRLELAGEGVLPTYTVGFEIFEEGGIGITNYERQVRYKRALEGSLARSIQSNPDIQRASVQVALPQEEALFKEDEEPITASVKLQLRPFAQIDKESVRGIVNLVSYAVVGLESEDIVVLDEQDRILSDFDRGDESSVKQIKQLQVKNEIERKLEGKLRSSLGRILTRDRIAVAATVDMNFDRIEKTMEEYRQPEGSFEQLRQSEETMERSLEGEDVRPGGQAGTESNIPGAEEVDGQVTKYDETKQLVDYFADKNITKIVEDPAVTRISALVSVDHRLERGEDEDGKITYHREPLEENEIEGISRLARAAIGFDEERGDQVEVLNVEFDRGEEIRRLQEEARQEEFRRRVIYFSVIALGLTFLIAGALLLWQRQRQREIEQAIETEPEMPRRDLMAEISIEEREEQQQSEQLRRNIEEDPDSAAQVLRSWFVEEL